MANLLIVESKSKCGKIESYLGKDYKCLASLGHIYELVEGLEAIEIHNNFNPRFRLMSSKRALVGDLQRAAKRATTVYLAADPDREGEAIAYHLSQALKVSSDKIKRITFNEISKKAVQEALANPREIDIPLCDAQKARRVLDRLFGFTISPVLWDYVGKSLSAGRCQSPALEIICQREQEISNFASNMFYSIFGDLNHPKGCITVKYQEKIPDLTTCQSLMEFLLLASYTVSHINQINRTSKPPPPHTTSTLQQEASNRLSMNPKTTMQIAQKLYEKGHITYMRTDSTILSEDAKRDINKYVLNTYGENYHHPRNFTSKVKNTQEAHECIRPVKIGHSPDQMKFTEPKEGRLYEMIWKRAVGSQMAERQATQQIMTILATVVGKQALELFTDEEITTFMGYEILYQKAPGKITDLKVGEILSLEKFKGEEKDTKPKPRYTEASLVKELERSGIGRPSTFSNIVTTLLERNYVELGTNQTKKINRTNLFITKDRPEVTSEIEKKNATSEKGKLRATILGLRVRTFLGEHFQNILSEGLTSEIEDRLDNVANGQDDWVSVVREFYQSFYPTVEKLTSEKTTNSKKMLEIGILGKYCYSIINTKYGPAFSKTETNRKMSKPTYLTVCKNLYGDGSGLSLDQVKTLYKFPRKIRCPCGKEIDLCYGKNGFYLKYGSCSTNLVGDYSNGQVPSENDMGCFMDMIDEYQQEQGETGEGPLKRGIIKKIGVYHICRGPYGLFIANTKTKRKPVSVSDDTDLDTLTEVDCLKLIKNSYNSKK